MKCPVCETVELALAERERVEIDYCPNGRGVWLDRGELDKVIERYDGGSRCERDEDFESRRERAGGRPRRNRRESLLGEFFDLG